MRTKKEYIEEITKILSRYVGKVDKSYVEENILPIFNSNKDYNDKYEDLVKVLQKDINSFSFGSEAAKQISISCPALFVSKSNKSNTKTKKMTKEEFIKDVCTFSPNNKYGYKFQCSSTMDGGKHFGIATKGNKMLISIYKGDKPIMNIVFNTDTEETHRFDETTAYKYL